MHVLIQCHNANNFDSYVLIIVQTKVVYRVAFEASSANSGHAAQLSPIFCLRLASGPFLFGKVNIKLIKFLHHVVPFGSVWWFKWSETFSPLVHWNQWAALVWQSHLVAKMWICEWHQEALVAEFVGLIRLEDTFWTVAFASICIVKHVPWHHNIPWRYSMLLLWTRLKTSHHHPNTFILPMVWATWSEEAISFMRPMTRRSGA